MQRHGTVIVIAFLVMLFAVGNLSAQTMSVASFEAMPNDMSAMQQGTKLLDQNGDPCAIIKIMTKETGFTFDVGSLGIVKTVNKVGEIWLYVPFGVKRISLNHPSLEPITYNIPISIEKGRVYRMNLVAKVVKTTNTFTLNYSPSTAVVLLDGNLIDGINGQVVAELTFGEHKYSVLANGYSPITGLINIVKERPSVVNVQLVSNGNVSDGKQQISPKQQNNTLLHINGVKYNQELVESANKGDATAQCNLGYFYFYGSGVQQDYSKAVEWFEKSANQGNAKAQNMLGFCYNNGNGVLQNSVIAVEWYKKSANQGEATGQSNLGFCYEKGMGVAQDYSKAADWYRKAANQGDATGQCNLGYSYFYGRGVQQDYSKAVEWFEKSANQGNAVAQNMMGICYNNGKGVSQNTTKAIEWYKQSANQGNQNAVYNLKLLGITY